MSCWTDGSSFSCYHITFVLLSVAIFKLLPGHVGKTWTHSLESIAKHLLWSLTLQPQNQKVSHISWHFLVDLNICGTQSSSSLRVVLVVSQELISELECLNNFYLALRHGQWLAELEGHVLVSTEFFLLLDICLPSHVTLKPICLSVCPSVFHVWYCGETSLQTSSSVAST